MVFQCKLCEEETVITVNLCEKCRKIKHMMNIYTREIVYDVLEKVLIRNTEQRQYKIKNYKKPETDIIDTTDNSYLQLKEKTHEEIKRKVLDKFSK